MFDLLIPLIILLPLAGFVITAVIGRRLDKHAHWIPVGVVVASWVLAMIVAFAAIFHAAPFGETGHGLTLYT